MNYKELTDEQEAKVDEIIDRIGDLSYYHFDSTTSVTLDGSFTAEDLKCLLDAFKYLNETTK